MPGITNHHNLKVGDNVTFTNAHDYTVSHTITRTSDKSVWYGSQRESWGTINSYIFKFNATITRS